MKRIDQFMASLVYGDAIGNHAMEIWKLQKELGIPGNIYAEHIDPRYGHAAKHYLEYSDGNGQVALYHLAIGSNVADFLLKQRNCTPAIYYHNITPAQYFEDININFANECRRGREQLKLFAHVRHAIAASEYNKLEMEAAGFTDVRIAHYSVDFARIERGARNPVARSIRARFDDDRFTILFVGRVVPNKCQHDLISLTQYYRTLIDPKVRLLLVGSYAYSGAYHYRLQTQIQRQGLDKNVEIAGAIGTDDGLAAVYERANAFVCMSEHEGFCVPIIEAMHFGVPVYAYRSTGVPYTLGDSGVLFDEKRFDWVAETVSHVGGDPVLREAIVSGQRARLGVFDNATTRARLRDILLQLAS